MTRFERGYTYLWVLILVAATGIGLALAFELYTSSVQREKERELLFIGRQFRNAIAQYYETPTHGTREYPATLDDLLKDTRTTAGRRHLRRIYADPMTGKPEWGLIRLGGRIVGVHSLSKKTPIKQAHFEAEEAAFAGKKTVSDWIFVYPFDLLDRVASTDQRTATSPSSMSSFSSGPGPTSVSRVRG